MSEDEGTKCTLASDKELVVARTCAAELARWPESGTDEAQFLEISSHVFTANVSIPRHEKPWMDEV